MRLPAVAVVVQQRVVERSRQRVDVGAPIGLAAAQLFRGGEQRRVACPARFAGRIDEPGQAEIDQHAAAVGTQQDVGGLDVAMDDAAQRGQPPDPRRRPRTAAGPAPKLNAPCRARWILPAPALDVLPSRSTSSRGRSRRSSVDHDEAGMAVEAGHRHDLAFELADEGRVARQLGVHDLHGGDLAGFARLVDLAPAAAAQQMFQLPAVEHVARLQRRRPGGRRGLRRIAAARQDGDAAVQLDQLAGRRAQAHGPVRLASARTN